MTSADDMINLSKIIVTKIIVRMGGSVWVDFRRIIN